MTAAAELLARGRRLQRIAMWLLAGALASLAGAVGGSLLAAKAGWIAEDDATIALVGLAVSVGCFVAMGVVNTRGSRLVRASIGAVADEPAVDVPEAVCFGYRRPIRFLAIAVPPYAAVLVALPFWGPAGWIGAVVSGVIGVTFLFGLGPAAAGFTGACIDAAGIALPSVGLRLPWSAVRSVTATPAGIEIMITEVAAIERTGGVPGHWTAYALAEYESGSPLKAYSPRPEVAMAVARRYLRKDPPAPFEDGMDQ
ncbi:MAG: hypothetical protein HOV83_05120 [Catenulispora sp.]|nr:hypothetical protein [Catenulispora sp.]